MSFQSRKRQTEARSTLMLQSGGWMINNLEVRRERMGKIRNESNRVMEKKREHRLGRA